MHEVTEAIIEAYDADALLESIERARETVTTTFLVNKILTCRKQLSSDERAVVVDELMEYLGV
jgi:KaiC/GvpD/RAD55 family RecA-like ATPase